MQTHRSMAQLRSAPRRSSSLQLALLIAVMIIFVTQQVAAAPLALAGAASSMCSSKSQQGALTRIRGSSPGNRCLVTTDARERERERRSLSEESLSAFERSPPSLTRKFFILFDCTGDTCRAFAGDMLPTQAVVGMEEVLCKKVRSPLLSLFSCKRADRDRALLSLLRHH
jgi:hypothetical protein